MKYPIGENEAVKESLRRAYFQKEGLEVGEHWRPGAMSRIRAMAPMKKGLDFWLGLEQLAWRLAPVTCALIIICALVFLGSDAFHDYEVLSGFTTDPEGLTLSQMIGIGAQS